METNYTKLYKHSNTNKLPTKHTHYPNNRTNQTIDFFLTHNIDPSSAIAIDELNSDHIPTLHDKYSDKHSHNNIL